MRLWLRRQYLRFRYWWSCVDERERAYDAGRTAEKHFGERSHLHFYAWELAMLGRGYKLSQRREWEANGKPNLERMEKIIMGYHEIKNVPHQG